MKYLKPLYGALIRGGQRDPAWHQPAGLVGWAALPQTNQKRKVPPAQSDAGKETGGYVREQRVRPDR